MVSDPYIEAPTFPNGATIGGSFTPAEAKSLAAYLNFGALPAHLEVFEVSTVTRH